MRRSTHGIRTRESQGRRDDWLDRKETQAAATGAAATQASAPVDQVEVECLAAIFAALRNHLGSVVKQEAKPGEYFGSDDSRHNLVVEHGGKRLEVLVTTDPNVQAASLLFISRDNITLNGGSSGTEWVKPGPFAMALVSLQRLTATNGTRTTAPTLMERLGLTGYDDEPAAAAPQRISGTLEELLGLNAGAGATA